MIGPEVEREIKEMSHLRYSHIDELLHTIFFMPFLKLKGKLSPFVNVIVCLDPARGSRELGTWETSQRTEIESVDDHCNDVENAPKKQI